MKESAFLVAIVLAVVTVGAGFVLAESAATYIKLLSHARTRETRERISPGGRSS
jgi:hypothetical protein